MFKIKERKLENYLWYKGDVNRLKNFYGTSIKDDKNSENNFYSDENRDVNRIVHSGVPALITDTIVDLIGIGGCEINVENDLQKEVIDNFYETNEIHDKLEQVVETLTWSGEGYVKYNVIEGNIDLNVVNPLNALTIKENGVIKGYKFIVREATEENKTRDIEKYGIGFIEFYTEKLKSAENDEWEVLQDTYRKMVFNKNIILANYVKVPKDAYSKSLQIFDVLDETYSRMPDEARKGRMMRFIDEALLKRDDKGNVLGEHSAFLKDFIKLQGQRSEDGKPLIEYIMADIDPEKRYLKAKKDYTSDIIRNAGLSYYTYAGGDTKGSTASADSQREMEKISIRTRKRYIHRLKKLIRDIFNVYLEMTEEVFNNTMIEYDEEGRVINEDIIIVDNNKYDINVSFDDYIQNSMEQRVKTWGSPEAQSNFNIEFRIKKVLENDLTDVEIEKLVNEVKIENGVSDDEAIESE